MTYLKSFFFNFLTVFFANYLLPGIQVMNRTKLPHLGGDLIFAIILGLLNASIYPILKAVNKGSVNMIQIGLVGIVLNFAVYALLKLTPFIGIHILTMYGYLVPAAFVAFVSILMSHYEMKHSQVSL